MFFRIFIKTQIEIQFVSILNYVDYDRIKAIKFLKENLEWRSYGGKHYESLYTKYWETYISLLYNPKTKMVNAKAVIPLAQYFDIELNDVAFFRGNHYHIRAINNYTMTSSLVLHTSNRSVNSDKQIRNLLAWI